MKSWSTAPPSTTSRSTSCRPTRPASSSAATGAPTRLFPGRHGTRRINIFQILMHSGMVNSVTSAAEQRRLADVLLKPPLANVDLLHWHAFDRAIEAGYLFARTALESLP